MPKLVVGRVKLKMSHHTRAFGCAHFDIWRDWRAWLIITMNFMKYKLSDF